MNNTSPLRLALVRHGETIFNRQNRFTGQKDPLLTSTGQSEAEALAKSLQVRFPNGVSKICTSHLLRCKKTAEIIATKVSVSVLS
jgi:probable phosphoglycerate mutase